MVLSSTVALHPVLLSRRLELKFFWDAFVYYIKDESPNVHLMSGVAWKAHITAETVSLYFIYLFFFFLFFLCESPYESRTPGRNSKFFDIVKSYPLRYITFSQRNTAGVSRACWSRLKPRQGHNQLWPPSDRRPPLQVHKATYHLS